MALFSKEKKVSDRERFLGQELTTTRYDSLAAALIGEIDLGSQDSKVTRIQFPDEREITILSNAGDVLLARDSGRPVLLSDFLYWTDLSSEDKSTLLLLANDAPLNENIFSAIIAKAPETLSVIRKVILDSTVEALLYAHRNFDSYETINTELYRNAELVKQLKPQGINLLEVEKLVTSTVVREEELLKILGIANSSLDDFVLKKGEKSAETGYMLEKRFVAAATEAEANLLDSYNISSGFRWVTVLQRLQELTDEGYAVIKTISQLEGLPSEVKVLRPHERVLSLTLDMETPLDSLIEIVFEFSGDLELARKLAADNIILEERVFEIEDWIIRELAAEEYEEFDDLPEDFQITLRGLVLERREINSKREEILERLRGIIIEDVHTLEDDRLREIIGLKLRGIQLAVDKLPVSHAPVLDSGFHLIEDKPEFNFSDARIIQDSEGASSVELLPEDHVEEEAIDPEPVNLEEMIQLAYEEVVDEPVKLEPVDLSLLDGHIARLNQRRKRRN